MLYNKHFTKSLEMQNIKKTRKFYHSLAEINLSLAEIHKSIELLIDKNTYQYATEYVNQFISYTTIWHLKFVYNLENPEVALLQIFHLNYIFKHEPASKFEKERRQFEELKEEFDKVNPFTQERISGRYDKMLAFIQESSMTAK